MRHINVDVVEISGAIIGLRTKAEAPVEVLENIAVTDKDALSSGNESLSIKKKSVINYRTPSIPGSINIVNIVLDQ